MKKICFTAVWLLFSALIVHDVYANDTIRWTWGVGYVPATREFSFSGTENEKFGIDWGDGRDTVVMGAGELSGYDAYVPHTYADTGVYAVRLYALTADAGITAFSAYYYLRTLDVDCPALDRLEFRYNRRLTDWDLSGCTALTSLDCRDNNLTSLDVSRNVNLTSLDCRDNNLTSLDVSRNVNMTNLYCSGNDLTSLDVTQNTNLWDLGCSGNDLTSLDVSKNVNLTSLDCSGNDLMSLDVSQNVNLAYLDCRNNNLSFGAVADIALTISQTHTESIACEFSPQVWSRETIEISKGVPVPDLPVIKGTQSHLDIYRNGYLIDNHGYKIVDNQLYFEEIGNYKLVVWHDSVRERKLDGYDENGDYRLMNVLYGDTTFVTVYSDYAIGNDIVYWTFERAKMVESYGGRDGMNLSFSGTAGGLFIIDWGDGYRTVIEGTGELFEYEHYYDTYLEKVQWKLYGATPEAHILQLKKSALRQSLYVVSETLNVSACPELTHLAWMGKNDGGRGGERRGSLVTLDISKNGNLQFLDCSFNALRLLDVSKNLNLKTLNCRENSLATLDVSSNVNLVELNCGVNPLGSLDVSRNINLMELTCEGNQLSLLDISKNISLIKLNCAYNLLDSLDISCNNDLWELNFCYNRLKTIDVSCHGNLTDLSCAGNKLSLLDVSKNLDLDFLDCRSNQLTSLDISKNTKLSVLYCNGNRLASLDVSRNAQLDYLECSDNRLILLDVSRNTYLYWLFCSGNRLTSLDLCAQTHMYSFANNGNFLKVPLDGRQSYDLTALPGMDVERILSVCGGRLDGTRIVFEADEVSYLYATGYQPENSWSNYGYDTVWFRLVADKHDEPQIPLTTEFFPDSIFRTYVMMLDKDGNDSLCGHERAMVEDINILGCQYYYRQDFWSYGIKSLDGIQYFMNLKSLDCGNNDLLELDLSENINLVSLKCGYNDLSSLNLLENVALKNLSCEANRLTALDISDDVCLNEIYAFGNQLPLSILSDIKIDRDSDYERISYSPQHIPVTLKIGQSIDLGKELIFHGVLTEVDFGDILECNYTFENGLLKFAKNGDYHVRLFNDTIYNAYHYINESEKRTTVVEVFYDITVKADGSAPNDPTDPDDPDEPGRPGRPDDPDAPDDPDDPTDPGVANEDWASDEAVSAPWAYVVGRTIHLTEPAAGAGLGEVEAFTAVGQRVYRGFDRSFTVPTAGVYVLRAADGRRCKVMVR